MTRILSSSYECIICIIIFLNFIQARENKFWKYNGHRIRYLKETDPTIGHDNSSPHVLMIHGFGGNADQFRYNLPYLKSYCKSVYAMDLLGYGYSDKPNPKELGTNQLYNFENWSDQINSFIMENIQAPTVLISNSVGGVAALQSAVTRPDLIEGVVLINISMRKLHLKKQSVFIRPVVKAIQTILRETDIGNFFFQTVATPNAIRNILNQAYGYQGTSKSVDKEIVDLILQPGLLPGAVDVFLDFISYSGGPLPEELLPQVNCPVRFLWGANDPWEPINEGRELYFGDKPGINRFDCVDEFVELEDGGHCPMDQIPDRVNAEILRFLKEKVNSAVKT